jgi:twitching motility protein PilJ
MSTPEKTSSVGGGIDRLLVNWLPHLVTIGAIVFILMATNFYYGSSKKSEDQQYINKSGELRLLSQRIAKNAPQAASGNKEAFADLEDARNQFGIIWNILDKGDPATGLPQPADTDISTAISGAQAVWLRVFGAANVILERKDSIVGLYSVVDLLRQSLQDLNQRFQQVNEKAVAAQLSGRQVLALSSLSIYSQSLQTNLQKILQANLQKILQAGGDSAKVAEDFRQDARLLAQALAAIQSGGKADMEPITSGNLLSLVRESADIFSKVQTQIDYIATTSLELQKARKASDDMFRDAQALLDSANMLVSEFNRLPNKRYFGHDILSYSFGTLLLICLVLMFIAQRSAERQRLQEAREHLENEAANNKRNQEAIMRLLNEMEPLSEGDLTINATVTEDFTGAIADAINFTIDAQRTLVSTINGTVERVGSAMEETQSTAVELSQASEHQAQEISGASAAINEMASSIEQVSTNASESTSVAEKSVKIAKTGAVKVRNTIKGMDNIREHIKETSHRIKRLGESSQEIGDIVSLITDIADQTNILAINAAIQAAMAGDAGRGFAVVADQVHKLAEKSSKAAKEIETRVKTIQSDTREAVISMEQSTAEVVEGAKLAQDAGVSLEEIESVSGHLADLIQNISNAAAQQAASANHISNTMHVIQEITNQTSGGTAATAAAIGKLAELADELRASVAGFKLPH